MRIPFPFNLKISYTSASADVSLSTLLNEVIRVAALFITAKVRYIHLCVLFYFIENFVHQNVTHGFTIFVVDSFVSVLMIINTPTNWNNASKVSVFAFLASFVKKFVNEFFS